MQLHMPQKFVSGIIMNAGKDMSNPGNIFIRADKGYYINNNAAQTPCKIIGSIPLKAMGYERALRKSGGLDILAKSRLDRLCIISKAFLIVMKQLAGWQTGCLGNKERQN